MENFKSEKRKNGTRKTSKLIFLFKKYAKTTFFEKIFLVKQYILSKKTSIDFFTWKTSRNEK